jgi:hypothetical protein
VADIPDPIDQIAEVFATVGSQIADLLPPILERADANDPAQMSCRRAVSG